MPITLSRLNLFSKAKIELLHHDPNSVLAMVVSPDGGTTLQWRDMQAFGAFAVLAMSSRLTGAGIAKLEIVAAVDDAGAHTTVIKDSGAVVCDALGDYVVAECLAIDIAQLGEAAGYALRYVAARLTLANAADEAAVTYICFEPRRGLDEVTQNYIAP